MRGAGLGGSHHSCRRQVHLLQSEEQGGRSAAPAQGPQATRRKHCCLWRRRTLELRQGSRRWRQGLERRTRATRQQYSPPWRGWARPRTLWARRSSPISWGASRSAGRSASASAREQRSASCSSERRCTPLPLPFPLPLPLPLPLPRSALPARERACRARDRHSPRPCKSGSRDGERLTLRLTLRRAQTNPFFLVGVFFLMGMVLLHRVRRTSRRPVGRRGPRTGVLPR